MRFAVLMNGILRGMGHEVPCELLATKTVLAEASRPVYSHCAIIEAASGLPDGDYEVEFGGEVAITRKQHGSWTVAALLPHTYSEAERFYASRTEGKSGETERDRTKDADNSPSSGKAR